MKSIRDIYKIGKGPSSSHTIGPERAAKHFRAQHPDAEAFQVDLFGSLSKTGKGSCGPVRSRRQHGLRRPAGLGKGTPYIGKKILDMRYRILVR